MIRLRLWDARCDGGIKYGLKSDADDGGLLILTLTLLLLLLLLFVAPAVGDVKDCWT